MEDELETLLEQAISNQQGREDDAEQNVDTASSDAASFLIGALTSWNKGEAGDYSTFGAFARSLTGDNEFVTDPGATDAEIEEAARDATAEYERRRTAMRNADQGSSSMSMSIGPRAKLDAVQARLDARLENDPVARRKIAAEAARRLRKLETDWTTERLTWKGDKIKAISDPRSRKSLDKEQAFREAAAVERELAARGLNGDDIARSKDSKDYEMWHRFQESKHLLMERGMGEWEATALADFGASKWRKDFVETIKEVTAIAQAEGAEWRKGIDARQAKDYSPRASLLRDMRTLDAIVGALPPEIRYQVGGQIKLAGLATDEARADEIARRGGDAVAVRGTG
jgi:hypothetical protein